MLYAPVVMIVVTGEVSASAVRGSMTSRVVDDTAHFGE
jgi:hypothetical protein